MTCLGLSIGGGDEDSSLIECVIGALSAAACCLARSQHSSAWNVTISSVLTVHQNPVELHEYQIADLERMYQRKDQVNDKRDVGIHG